jgi:hypothetical protein
MSEKGGQSVTTSELLIKYKEAIENRISNFEIAIKLSKDELEAVNELIRKENGADINPPQ